MLGWLREARSFASRSKRVRRSTSCENAGGRPLMATSRPRRGSRARLISPIPPRIVERARANEENLGASAVDAPDRDPARGTPVDVVRRAPVQRHRDRLGLSGENLHARRLDQHIDDEGASRVLLTVQAVAAMHEHRLRGQAVANRPARASTFQTRRHVSSDEHYRPPDERAGTIPLAAEGIIKERVRASAPGRPREHAMADP